MHFTVTYSDTNAARTHMTLRLIAQDPTVLGDDGRILTAQVKVPWSRTEEGPRGARLHVVDFDVTSGAYLKHPALGETDAFADAPDDVLLTDRAFHAQQVYAATAKTLATFEYALGRRLPWGFDGHQLYLVPHAFAEGNAFYSHEERSLLFGYIPSDDGGEPVYTCLSYDVVVHEATHAILDGLRGRFLEPGLPDQRGFHEGFADIVALLSVFSMRPVVEQSLGKANAAGRITRRQVEPTRLKAGVLTSVAEQVGRVLTQGRGPLRRSAMEPPPQNWADLPEYLEPHNRGEVLVAVVLDVLVDIWSARLEALFSDPDKPTATLDRARAAEEGAKAASQLLTMMIRGIDYLPPAEFEFEDLLEAVLLADVAVVPDDDLDYRDLLTAGFAQAGIHRPDRANDVLGVEVERQYVGFNQVALRSDRNEVFRFVWQNAEPLDISTDFYTVVESVLPTQRIGPDGLIVSEAVATYIQMADMLASEFESISGLTLPPGVEAKTPLQFFGGGTLVFDQFGRLKLHIVKRLDDWPRQLRRLDYLAGSGIRDSKGRLGFSTGTPRGQAFAELHRTELYTGEAW